MSEIEKFDDDKESFLNELMNSRPDLMFPEAWSQAKKNEAVALVRPNAVKNSMLNAIPMYCKGSACRFADICGLQQKGLAPVGLQCAYEQAYVRQFFLDYVEELEVDTTRMVEVSMVRDLVDQEVQYIRASKTLSQEFYIQENVVGIDGQGNPVTKKELHQAVELEDKIHRRKEKLRNALLATREARAKAGQGALDTAQAISKLVEDVRKIESTRQKTLMKKLGMETYDEYIDAEEVEEE